MQIVCPKCATAYEVSAAAIGARMRPVRCARCHATWQVPAQAAAAQAAAPDPASDPAVAAFQQELGTNAGATRQPPPAAPADHPVSVEQALAAAQADVSLPPPADIETAAAAASLAEHSVEFDGAAPPAPEPVTIADAPPLAPEAPPDGPPAEFEPPPRRRPLRRPPAEPAFDKRMAIIIAGLLVIVSSLIGFRAEIVRHAPQMASLYSTIGLPVNLRKLVFTDVQLSRETHDGVPVLVVDGTIFSTSSTPVTVPRLRFALRNAAGAEIYTWSTQPPQAKLPPFEAVTFRGRLASPPPDGREVVVRFFNQRDTVN